MRAMAQRNMGSARDALRHADFRRLLGTRLVSQTADGFLQAALVASIAFSPERQNTAAALSAGKDMAQIQRDSAQARASLGTIPGGGGR